MILAYSKYIVQSAVKDWGAANTKISKNVLNLTSWEVIEPRSAQIDSCYTYKE